MRASNDGKESLSPWCHGGLQHVCLVAVGLGLNERDEAATEHEITRRA
jgi:hypothetical protein